MLPKLFYNIEMKGGLPNSSYTASIILIPTHIRKQQKKTINHFFWAQTKKFPKNFKKKKKGLLVIKQCIKLIYSDQVCFFPGMQEWYNIFKNQSNAPHKWGKKKKFYNLHF